MTKHKVIQATTKDDFEEQLDAMSNTYKVFATQTHIEQTSIGDATYYAICFIKEE